MPLADKIQTKVLMWIFTIILFMGWIMTMFGNFAGHLLIAAGLFSSIYLGVTTKESFAALFA